MTGDRLAAAVAELVDALRAELAAERPADASPDRLMDLAAASALLGIGRSALYGELQAGRLRSIKIGRRRLVPSSAVAEYVARPPDPPRAALPAPSHDQTPLRARLRDGVSPDRREILCAYTPPGR